MSELKHQLMMNKEHSWVFAYLKSEADKVIAELEKKLKVQSYIAEEGWKEFRTYHSSYAESVKELYKKNKELRHNKYKRCLAMSKICENKLGTVVKPAWWDRWHKRWLKLAEKFKEAE